MRLAERMGLLTGRNLSPVATFGVEILMVMDSKRANDDFFLAFKARLGAAHPERIPDLFPNPTEDPYEKARTEDGDLDIDKINDDDLEWSVPTEQESSELEQWLAEHMSGSATSTDLDTSGGEWM